MLENRVLVEKINPTNNLVPQILKNQFYFRKTGEFKGKSQLVIADMDEPTWWNRPLNENTNSLLKVEADGLYSFNLPIALKYDLWKAKYNLLLNENNLPLAIHLKFNHQISAAQKAKLETLTFRAIEATIIDLGIPKEKLTYLNNDILLNGKKFVGGEHIIGDDIYEENIFFTLGYQEEKDIFDRLTGEHAKKTKITGVFDEFQVAFTKADCMRLYQQNLLRLLSEITDGSDLVDEAELTE